MYLKRIQLENCGPIENLQIEFPHNEDRIKPVLFVGKNGSGKSIVLSYIVNGLMWAKQEAYPESPEVDSQKAFKPRNPFYVKEGQQYAYARVDYEEDVSYWELVLIRKKKDFASNILSNPPDRKAGSPYDAWKNMHSEESTLLGAKNITDKKTASLLSERCTLYFPPERFELPAWLNEDNLKYKASIVYPKLIQGYTERRITAYSRFREVLDWVFNLAFDTRFRGEEGKITANLFNISLRVFQTVLQKHGNISLRLGNRRNRVLKIRENNVVIAHNAFQLSSGEISLLSIFLSIIKDYDETGQLFLSPEKVRGIVIIDEIDLHLHSNHLYDVLPELIKMFPKVQFVITTHSPLFLLGLSNALTPEGLTIYQMPAGQEIKPEEFGEFGEVYEAYKETKTYREGLRRELSNAQKPLLFVEGVTNVEYLKKAADLLGYKELFNEIDIRDGGGRGDLSSAWQRIGSFCDFCYTHNNLGP